MVGGAVRCAACGRRPRRSCCGAAVAGFAVQITPRSRSCAQARALPALPCPLTSSATPCGMLNRSLTPINITHLHQQRQGLADATRGTQDGDLAVLVAGRRRHLPHQGRKGGEDLRARHGVGLKGAVGVERGRGDTNDTSSSTAAAAAEDNLCTHAALPDNKVRQGNDRNGVLLNMVQGCCACCGAIVTCRGVTHARLARAAGRSARRDFSLVQTLAYRQQQLVYYYQQTH